MFNASRHSAISCCLIAVNCLMVCALIGFVESPASALASEGPIAAYSFDEGEGATAEDITGNSHTATLEGASWARGHYGSGLEFDGENDCVSIANSAELNFTEEFTVEAWVRPSDEENRAIITQEDNAATEGEEPFAYSLLVGGESGGPRGWLRKGGEEGHQGVAGGEPLPPGAWSHVAFTDDGARLRIYLDGELVGTNPAIPLTTAAGPLTIGCLAEYGNYFKGRLDEVRIYNRALGGDEVAADKAAPIQTPQAGPIAAYSFDEGEGTTVEDLTGHEHTATIHGASWSAHGRYGGAMEFDAEKENYVSIPASSELDGNEELTVEAWVRPSESPYLGEIAMKEREGSSPKYSWTLDQHLSEPAGYFMQTEEGMVAGGEGSLPLATWTHVALTDDGAHNRLYVNGELVDTEPAIPFDGHGEIRIGGNGVFSQWFDGRIDEVRIYNRALDGGEVAADRAAPIQTPQAAPIAAYSFDEGEGAVAEDLTGNEHNGALEGAEWTNGKYGSALKFDGEEDCLSIPESPDFQFSEEFTLEAWVRPTSSGIRAIISAEDESAAEEEEPFAYSLLTGGEEEGPRGWFRKGGESGHGGVGGGEELPQNAWSHLALTDDGAKLRLYIDGQLVATQPAIPLTVAKGPLTIGCLAQFGNYFKGKIDEVRVYNRALDGGEVAADKTAPIQTPQAGPVAAYSFDVGEGAVAEDVTGNEHDGNLEGAGWARGRYGSGLQFDGENDCLSIPNSAELNFSEEFTVEAWVRPSDEENRAIITQEDNAAAEGEEPFAYSLLVGGEGGGPRGWLRRGGEEGHEGVAGGDPLPPGAWSHVAFIDDGARLRVYLDGELVGTNPTIPLTAAAGPLSIGCLAEYGNYFKGRLDEVRIYNRALDGEEVAASLGSLPFVQTEESETDSTEAVLLGVVNPMSYVTTYRFEYGTSTAYGKSIPESAAEIERWLTGDEPEEVDQAIDELEPETTYHYRIVATNALGSFVGHDQTFTTSAAEPSPLAATSFEGRVGINWSGLETSPTETQEVDESGAEMFRVVVKPGCTKNEEDLKKHRTHNDELFLSMAQNHVTLLPDVSGIPCGERGNTLPPIGSGSGALKQWKDGLEALAKRYGPEGGFWEKYPGLKAYAPTFWEIWNEENVEKNAAPNGEIVPERYGQLLGASNDLLEKVDNKIKILFGGLLTIGKTKPKLTKQGPIPAESEMTIRTFLKRAGHTGDYDAVSLHPYAFKGNVTSKVAQNIYTARKAVNRWGGGQGKDIWITEIGWAVEGEPGPDPVHLAISPAVQEERLNSVFDKIKDRSAENDFNIKNLFWYNIRDVAGGAWEAHCGLIDREGNQRSAFAAFKAQAE
jgi:hypothetical protein